MSGSRVESSSNPVPAQRRVQFLEQPASLKPIPVRRATLLALFPPEEILQNRSTAKPKPTKSLSFELPSEREPLDPLSGYKDLASVFNPTAPRVPNPLSPSLRSPPANVLRGPKGVNHPNLRDLLNQRRSVGVPHRQATEPNQQVPSPTPEPRSDNEETAATSHSSDSSADNKDAYAELVIELAKHEALVQQQRRSMPLHETSFLPLEKPQDRSGAPTQESARRNGNRTPDSELNMVQLRRANSLRYYQDERVESKNPKRQTPSPLLIKPQMVRASLPPMYKNPEDVTKRAPVRASYEPPVSVQSRLVRQPAFVARRSETPVLQRTSGVMSPRYGTLERTNGTSNAAYNALYSGNMTDNLPPMMQRSYSLNPAQIRDMRRAKSASLPMQRSYRAPDTGEYKRVSFSPEPRNGDTSDNYSELNGNKPEPVTSIVPYSPRSKEHKSSSQQPDSRRAMGVRANLLTLALQPSYDSETGSEAGDSHRALYSAANFSAQGLNNPSDLTFLNACERGDVEMVEMLRSRGSNLSCRDINGSTGLMVASKNGHEELVIFFLEHRVDVNLFDKKGATALLYAAEGGQSRVASLLLQNGALIHRKTHSGCSAIYLAACNGHTETVQLLLEYGARVDCVNDLDITPLLIASQQGRVEVVKCLLANRANPNHKNIYRTTALMYASLRGHAAIVRLLLENGANWNIQNNESHTALSLAIQGNQFSVIRILAEWGVSR